MKSKSNRKDIESAQSQDLVDGKRQQQQLLVEGSKTLLAQQEFEEDEHAVSQHNNNNNSNSTAKQHKTTTMTSLCFERGRWLLLLSMTTALIITAILVAMLTISLLDNEDQCLNSLPFQQASYKLFSTKTTYSTTHNLLNGSSAAAHSAFGGAANFDYYYQHNPRPELPKIFSRGDSLRSIHERLTSREFNCKPKQLHYFGRHAARYPSSEDIEFINKQLANVQSRIDLSKFSPNNGNNQNQNQQASTQQQGNNSASNNSNSTSNVCFNPLAQYKQWTTFMSPELGNLVMDSGLEETGAIAQRLRSIYPEMFDGAQAKISIGTTEELRTAQTSIAFIRQISNFKLGICDDNLEAFEPASTTSRPQTNPMDEEELASRPRPTSPQNNRCYQQFLDKYRADKLQFHKRCESYHREKLSLPYNLNLNEPNRTSFITGSVSKKLKLSKEDWLSSNETAAIYKICKYEAALTGSSIWCNLFSDTDLKFYEYLNDIDDFFNQAYGHPDQMRSACPVTTELMRAFKRPRQGEAEAFFYFTHSEVIQKILAASVDLEQDPDYSLGQIQRHLREGSAPESRQWRTSLYTPFSANLAFTLYECPKSSKQQDETTGGYQIFDVTTESPWKVVAALNERPIQLDGCSSPVCDLNELVNDSRIDREKRCKLEDICKVKREYT